MQRRRFLTGSALLAGAGLVPLPAMARRLFPADVTDRYVAWQGERVVGRQEISFDREPGQFVVHVKTAVRFAAPGAGDVSFNHDSREVWQAGWLHGLTSRTRIDGRAQTVRAQRQSGSLMVDGSEVRPFQVSTYLVPSSLWHRDSRLVDAFLDVEKGAVLFVRPRYAGKETLQQGGGNVEAHRYTIRGQLNRETWYDADCVLVRWDLPLTGGDWLSFRREMA
jgi:hypothetical protein